MIVTFGGGVVVDMGGWVASCYMRGVPYVNLPTTLVGQVDAGIGGKLAVNHPVAKNLIGGFCAPRGVISDVSYLRTLDRRQLRAGLAESIKKAIIASPAYWDLIEDSAEPMLAADLDALARLVHGAGAIKAELIAAGPVRAGLAPHARLRPRDRPSAGDGHRLWRRVARRGRGVRHGRGGAHGGGSRALSGDPLGCSVCCGESASRRRARARRADRRRRLLAAIERIRLIRGGGYRFVCRSTRARR